MLRRCTLVLAFVLGACGTADAIESEDSIPATALPTVPGVGSLPDTIPVATFDERDDAEEPIVSVVVTRPVDDDGVVVESVAERVNGNRLLVIGDSILASTATRYGKELCEALNPIGWSVEVSAEPGRFVDFGNEVARARLDVGDEEDEFDAVVIHLGSNYGRDKDAYYEQLSELLYRAAPRPTLLLTVTEYRPQWSEVNDAIDELAALYDNVTIVDWEKIARAPGVLSRDGLHPGDQGEAVLVEQIAVALGELETDEGDCLRSSFTDDSAIGRGSGSSGGSSSGGSSSGGSSSSGSSSGGSSSSGSSSGGSSSGGSSSGGSSGGSTTGGTTTGGTTSGTTGGTTGATTGGETTGGDDTGGDTGETTTGGETTGGDGTGGDNGGTTTGGETTTGGDTTGGETTGGETTGGDGTGGDTGGTTTGGETTGGDSTTGGDATTGGSATGGDATTGSTGGDTGGGSDSGSSAATGGSDSGGSAATGGSDSGGAATSGGGGDTGAGADTGGAAATGGSDTGGDGG